MLDYIERHRRVMRSAILVLALILLAGPWAFDRIMVPAEFDCSAPYVRLDADFCGHPLAGIQLIGWAALVIPDSVIGYLTYPSQKSNVIQALMISFGMLLVPISFMLSSISTFAAKRERWRGCGTAAWLGASLAAFAYGGLGYSTFRLANWGAWLYGILGSIVFIVELLFILRKAKS